MNIGQLAGAVYAVQGISYNSETFSVHSIQQSDKVHLEA